MKGDITDLAVSSNNAVVASASNDFSIRVVRTWTITQIISNPSHSCSLRYLYMLQWRLPDGLPISVLQGHAAAVTAIAFSPRPNSFYQLLS